MRYSEFAPSPDLSPYVHCYWSLTGSAMAQRDAEPALPDGHPEFIINLASPFRARAGTRLVAQPRVMLVGQITRPFHVTATGDVSLFAVRLQPHAGALFHRPMSGITDAWRDARRANAEFDALRKSLGCDASPLEWIAATEHALRARVGANASVNANANTRGNANANVNAKTDTRGVADQRVQLAVRAIVEAHGAHAVEELASRANTTPRNLLRLFLRDVGVSPKMLSQIRRFQRVFSALRDHPDAWATIAIECGYFDQAHLIRDFTRFAGGAPAGLIARLGEFTRQFTALRTPVALAPHARKELSAANAPAYRQSHTP